MGDAGKTIRTTSRWALPAMAALAVVLLWPGTSQARVKRHVNASQQARVDAAQAQIELHQTQRDNDLTGDRTDVQMARIDMADNVAALREQLLVDRQDATHAKLCLEYPDLYVVTDPGMLDCNWPRILADDQRAMDQAHRDGQAAVRAAMAQLAEDDAHWRDVLTGDRRELNAARRAAGL